MDRNLEGMPLLNGSESSFNELREFAFQRHIPVLRKDAEQMLRVLLRLKQPANILEIGTCIGFSGCRMLIESPQAKLNTMEIDEQSCAMAEKNFRSAGVAERATIFRGDAREIVRQLTGRYDFIFLDGPKGQYPDFYPYLKELLLPNGTLVCDNVLYMGLAENVPDDKRHKHITISKNMNRFLEMIKADKSMVTAVLPTEDGMSVSVKI